MGMPDLHPGKGVPIGASVITKGYIYPQLVDNDIGCGMAFIKTGIPARAITQKKLENWKSDIKSIDCPWKSDKEEIADFLSKEMEWVASEVLPPIPEIAESHFPQLGTIGKGNHFAEFQEFDQIFDHEALSKLGIDIDEVHLLVHSGSRSVGDQILGDFLEGHKGSLCKGAQEGSDEF